MARIFAILLIGLVIGGCAGFVIGRSSITDDRLEPAMDHSSHAHAHGDALVIQPGDDAPGLDIELSPDPVSGWNLEIRAENFRFAGENAGKAHVPGEGHAHIYVNGQKIARAYSNWFHLETLPPGRVEVEVTLNSNDHRSLTVGDAPLSATVSFLNTVKPE